MKANIGEIELGIEFVSTDMGGGDNEAFLSLATGELYYRSDYVDEDIPLPNDLDDQTKYLALPHKKELDLGVALVFNFVQDYCPDKYSEVSIIFKKSGAYRRFSNWLEQHNFLNDWYSFKNEATKQAIIAWCKDNNIDV